MKYRPFIKELLPHTWQWAITPAICTSTLSEWPPPSPFVFLFIRIQAGAEYVRVGKTVLWYSARIESNQPTCCIPGSLSNAFACVAFMSALALCSIIFWRVSFLLWEPRRFDCIKLARKLLQLLLLLARLWLFLKPLSPRWLETSFWNFISSPSSPSSSWTAAPAWSFAVPRSPSHPALTPPVLQRIHRGFLDFPDI